jgi:AraC-like DNA-binding protein
MNNVISLPEEIGNSDVAGETSRSGIFYCRWDLEFSEDTDAKKTNNNAIDEVQIIFNLTRDITWMVGEDPSDQRFQKVFMRKGDACIYRNDDISTSMSYQRNVPFRFKSLQMKTTRFQELLRMNFTEEEIRKIEDIVFSRVETIRISPDMYRILSEIDSADRYAEFKSVVLEAKMIELVALVLFGIMHAKEQERSALPFIDPKDMKALERIREKIQFSPANDYEAPKVAETLSMSVSKLNRLFREVYGTSLHAYVQDMRLGYAAELLLSGKENVTEAAVKSGYNHMSHFTKSFKKKFGMTPSAFRERKVIEKDQ